jgi:hypothetical protein
MVAEWMPPADWEENVRRALAAPDPAPAFVEGLAERLRGQAVARAPRGPWLAARGRWAWALALLLILLLAAFAIGPANIVAAMQRLLGYIPGVGLVDDSTRLRVLAAPVTLEREGITVTVSQAVVDSERTVVLYQAEGIPPEAYPESEDAPFCGEQPQLRPPGGVSADVIGGRGGGWGTEGLMRAGTAEGQGWRSGYEWRLVYPALPTDVNEAIFFIPCLDGTAPGAAPEDWELTLSFVPAPPDVTVVPVLEMTPSPQSSAEPGEPVEAGLVLEQVIELEDRYILIGSFRQGSSIPGGNVLGVLPWLDFSITAGDDQPWIFWPAEDVDLPEAQPGVVPWAFEVLKGFTTPPLTLRVDAVDAQFPADVTIQFDTGPAPQDGQEWSLNRDLQIAGHTVTLVSAVLHRDERQNGYEFFFRSAPEVTDVVIEDREHTPVGGYGGGGSGGFSAGLVYEGAVPTGPLTYHITAFTARVEGPWTLTWSPPPSSAPVTPIVLPRPCFTLEDWQRVVAEPAPMPEGLSGRLIAYGRIIGDGDRLSPDNAGVFVFDLATGERQVLGPGTWPTLSDDGRRAAYSWSEGLHVVDLTTGENRVVPGTTTNDYNPRFSPDGSRLAFVRIDDLNLYVVNLDGSGLQRVTEGPEYELLVGWSPDGGSLVYGVPGPGGISLRSVDLVTGAVRDMLAFDGKDAWASFSPDGESVAYVARVPGALGYGLYLARPDGSEPRLLAQLEHWGIEGPIWSPDGNWLLVNVVNSDLPVAEITPALIDPGTCQAIPLTGVDGTVQDWAP